ncbi:hypothetical protein BH10PLA1_BH10PLA1_16810 [soil metagenome]
MTSAGVPILNTTFRLMAAVASGRANGSMNQLARSLGVAPSTCFRILKSLESADWVRRCSDRGGYEISTGLVTLADPGALARRLLARYGDPIRSLAARTGLTTKLSLRVGDEAETIVRCEPANAMSVSSHVGGRFHVCLGSSGAAVIATADDEELQLLIDSAPKDVWARQTPRQFMSRVRACRQNGWCIDRGSYHAKVHSISVALGLPSASAALTFLALPDDLRASRLPALSKDLKRAVDACRKLLSPSDALNPMVKS